MTTVYPDKPPKDFNDWILHIQKSLYYIKLTDRINSQQLKLPDGHDELVAEIQRYTWAKK